MKTEFLSGRLARGKQAGSMRTVVVVATAFVVGAGATALLLRPGAGGTARHFYEQNAETELSAATLEALQNLGIAVEIRYYASLEANGVSQGTPEFAARVGRLLDAYSRASGGKVTVVRYDKAGEETISAAAADGIKPFNLESGNPNYLGLAMAAGGRKEVMPHLSQAWEQALEPDLTRALVRVVSAPPPAGGPAGPVLPSRDALETVKAAIPDLTNVSVEEGRQLLRERSLKTFSEAAREMQARLAEVQQRLAQTLNGGSEAEQKSVREELQRVQAEQTEKLQAITAQLNEQISALEYLKKQ